MYVRVDDYFGNWQPMATPVHFGNAMALLDKVNDLMDEAFAGGVDFEVNPKTGSHVSGEKYGGFRPADCPVGAKGSSHKSAQAVDVYDPHGDFGRWCLLHLDRLASRGLYMEHPTATPVWVHLTTRAPASGRVAFMP